MVIGTCIGILFATITLLVLQAKEKKRLHAELARTRAAKEELLFIIGEVKETTRFTVKQSDTINRIVFDDKGIDFQSPFQ